MNFNPTIALNTLPTIALLRHPRISIQSRPFSCYSSRVQRSVSAATEFSPSTMKMMKYSKPNHGIVDVNALCVEIKTATVKITSICLLGFYFKTARHCIPLPFLQNFPHGSLYLIPLFSLLAVLPSILTTCYFFPKFPSIEEETGKGESSNLLIIPTLNLFVFCDSFLIRSQRLVAIYPQGCLTQSRDRYVS